MHIASADRNTHQTTLCFIAQHLVWFSTSVANSYTDRRIASPYQKCVLRFEDKVEAVLVATEANSEVVQRG